MIIKKISYFSDLDSEKEEFKTKTLAQYKENQIIDEEKFKDLEKILRKYF